MKRVYVRAVYSRTAPCVPRCVSALDVALEPWTFPAGTSRRSWREHTPERSAGATGVHGCFPETPTPSRPSPVGSIALPSGMAGGAGGQRCSTCPTALLGLSQPWSSTRSFLYMGKGAREARWNSKVCEAGGEWNSIINHLALGARTAWCSVINKLTLLLTSTSLQPMADRPLGRDTSVVPGGRTRWPVSDTRRSGRRHRRRRRRGREQSVLALCLLRVIRKSTMMFGACIPLPFQVAPNRPLDRLEHARGT